MESFSTNDGASAILEVDFDDVAFGDSDVDGKDGKPLIRSLTTGVHVSPLAMALLQRAGD
ncbi:MAG: hypothetical protein RO009_07965 [Pseudorhodoplanes sp.]|nr:hypothetical protein [Pseudorhodoplanes sp.]